MNVKYSLSQYIIATLAAGAVLVMPTACNDDLGYQNVGGQQIGFKLTAPDTWHEGMPVNENAPTTHCTSVRALSGGDTKLYLHTVVADNPAEEKATVTRGTPVKGTAAFQERYKRFSLSGICYTGEYPDEEAGAQNDWTTEYAYNLYYDTTTGKAEKVSDKLFWPTNGQVRFFAFAPTVEDFNGLGTGGTLELSKATDKGSPTLTYTVPTDVTKQVDLMTVRADASGTTTPEVNLNFGHALTAVQIRCGKDMLAGTITEVTIAGIYGKGMQVIGSDKWTPFKDTKATYTISKEITLSPSTDENVADKIHVPENTPIAGTPINSSIPEDNLTFMLLPQTLPDGATMTIKFTDAATKTERTLSGSIAGQTWEAGKIITYSVSPSSININAKVEFDNKKSGDIIPYSGVWYDVKYNPAIVEIVQAGVDTTKIAEIPIDKISFKYKFENSETDNWEDCTTDADGLLTIAAQPAYTTMSNDFDKTSENGSEDSPFSLSKEYGETANCYLVDKAGYYSLPLVYGNGYLTLPAEAVNPDGFRYFPNHKDEKITSPSISGAVDAVLCWQDAPDLIDSASVKVVDGNKLVFRIRKQTLTQGNALLAVRNASKEIIWSWHIWVTPYKGKFYSEFYTSKTTANPTGYEMAKYNLGWCDHHAHNESRTFSLQAVIDMSAYGGTTTETVDLGTFTQMEFKGSDAGDNTYYQWGRKDPMLGGIYNSHTPKYQYKKYKKTDPDKNEFTMENKQVFNQYNQDGYNYSFCKNPGDAIDKNDYASNGVSIGYTIKHPYMFVTNSRCREIEGNTLPFNYRNHWHKPYKEYAAPYFKDTHIMFNAWDASAISAGNETANVQKTIYDPCPPKFKVPPFDAFKGGIQTAWNSGDKSVSNNAWTIKYNGEITFPSTGVRNYALRTSEWKTVVPLGSTSDADQTFCEAFYKTSVPAFQMLTFLTSATIYKKTVSGTTTADTYNAYQLKVFIISKNDRGGAFTIDNSKIEISDSSNSYGLPVRPIHEK